MKLLKKIKNNKAKLKDLDLILSIINNITGNTICAFGDAIYFSIKSYIKNYYKEFILHIIYNKCLKNDKNNY